jgi:hypothetical protein
MDYEDKLYLLRKKQMDLRNECNEYQGRKDLYERMSQMMTNFEVRSSQERFLLGDIHRLINFFEQKIDIVLLKLRDVDLEFTQKN